MWGQCWKVALKCSVWALNYAIFIAIQSTVQDMQPFNITCLFCKHSVARSEVRDCPLVLRSILSSPDDVITNKALVKWTTGETRSPRESPTPLLPSPPQVPHGLPSNWTRTSGWWAVNNRLRQVPTNKCSFLGFVVGLQQQRCEIHTEICCTNLLEGSPLEDMAEWRVTSGVPK